MAAALIEMPPELFPSLLTGLLPDDYNWMGKGKSRHSQLDGMGSRG